MGYNKLYFADAILKEIGDLQGSNLLRREIRHLGGKPSRGFG